MLDLEHLYSYFVMHVFGQLSVKYGWYLRYVTGSLRWFKKLALCFTDSKRT